ncbi:unnamed protein product [Phytomonas sp. EM1]|nr:unnamed protein product [Phytomonas sp. EM1]|eukprot:CCW63695.1 unnamed protein product [Phytomonas sp. isolate EM1]
MSSFYPFWTNATVAHESQQHHFPCCFPQASIHINDIFCTDHAAKEHDMKGDDAWETIILSNYMIDFEWLCQAVPALAMVQKQLIVLSGEKGTATVRVVESSAGSGDGSCTKVTRYSPVPESQDNHNGMIWAAIAGGIPHEKIVILEPPLPYLYGTHHSKFVLAINKHGIRVVICTANFIHDDWVNKTQGIYIQDFPFKSNVLSPEGGGDSNMGAPCLPVDDYQLRKGEDFRLYLQLYLGQVGLLPLPRGNKSRQIVSFSPQDLDAFDFCSAKVWLFGSVPGSHRGQRLMSFGINRLFSVLRNVSLSTEAALTNTTNPNDTQPVILSWQYSSQGSLNDKFLKAMQRCMTAPDVFVADLQVIYPSEDEVRCSLEGWRGGLSLPVRLRCCDPFINARLHRWGSSGDSLSSASELWRYALPHIKSYAALDRARRSIVWFALTSANLSQAAWGVGGGGRRGARPTRERFPLYPLLRAGGAL